MMKATHSLSQLPLPQFPHQLCLKKVHTMYTISLILKSVNQAVVYILAYPILPNILGTLQESRCLYKMNVAVILS